MSFEKPDYLPAAVWTFYQELIEPQENGRLSPLLLPKYDTPIQRLFGIHPDSPKDRNGAPEIAKTWRRLAKAINTAGGADFRAGMDWRHLFTLFWSMVGYERGAYSRLRRAKELAPEIARLAEELADALSEYREIREQYLVSIPDEGSCTYEWLESAARGMDDMTRYDYETRSAPYFGYSVYQRVDIQFLPSPDLMIQTLSNAFWSFMPECDKPLDYANATQDPGTSALVRAFLDAWSNYQGEQRPDLHPPTVMSAKFEIKSTDLARILTAIFGLEFTREAVKEARKAWNAENRKN